MKRLLLLFGLVLPFCVHGQPSPVAMPPALRAILATNETVAAVRNALGVVGDTNIVINTDQLEFVSDELNLKAGGQLPPMDAASLTNLVQARQELHSAGQWITNSAGSAQMVNNPEFSEYIGLNMGDPKVALDIVGNAIVTQTNASNPGLEVFGQTGNTNPIFRVSAGNGTELWQVTQDGVAEGSGALLTNISSANIVGGLTTNFTVLFTAEETNRLWFTNGILGAITEP